MARPDRKFWQEALLEVQYEIESEGNSTTSSPFPFRTAVIETMDRTEVEPPKTPPPLSQASLVLPSNEVITPLPPRPSLTRHALSTFGHWLAIGTGFIIIVLIAFFLAAYQRITVVTTYG